ncbi:hypothetical protein SERLADRAFT_399218 [Serpula lacrymans var. lacrymans S7.9]|uniref:Uncharacterized protein n=1 Tax=Serpula lacrymans var. lacrymans (strain S7.9) TaxID=578457 RepID=F8P7K5_SERL9|nr:uncharacterized protein SERLADRAFT_399218 [Serpula lacrymans var. lacrymans S7.9]EGO21416.1 hypothetical protein SERLADRAFT_399218 [Serpula lacrymans var. lacrymans S7.9]
MPRGRRLRSVVCGRKNEAPPSDDRLFTQLADPESEWITKNSVGIHAQSTVTRGGH